MIAEAIEQALRTKRRELISQPLDRVYPALAQAIVECIEDETSSLIAGWFEMRAKVEETESQLELMVQAQAKAIAEIAKLQEQLGKYQAENDHLEYLCDKYKWQVRDTCTRAENAEERAEIAEAEVQRLDELVDGFVRAAVEMSHV